MKLTQKQVETHFKNEDFELAYATEAQIDKLCRKLGDDLPRMMWSSAKEEMEYIFESAKREFADYL